MMDVATDGATKDDASQDATIHQPASSLDRAVSLFQRGQDRVHRGLHFGIGQRSV
jgi:hypothetical protein